MVYSETPLAKDSFSCGDLSVVNQLGLIDWFLYNAPYSREFFKKKNYQNHLLIIYVSKFAIALLHYSSFIFLRIA